MSRVESAVARLRESERSGELADLCRHLRLDLLVLFGGAAHDPGSARDVDLAYARRRGDRTTRHLDVVNALGERFGDAVDVLDLDAAGSVARYEALHDVDVLFEGTRDRFAEDQIASFGAFNDTRRLRERMLEVLSE